MVQVFFVFLVWISRGGEENILPLEIMQPRILGSAIYVNIILIVLMRIVFISRMILFIIIGVHFIILRYDEQFNLFFLSVFLNRKLFLPIFKDFFPL